MKDTNIVLFSSGISADNGILVTVQKKLEARGYHCCYWRDLFLGAHDMNNIALLPMLIKKIPTFDFALLICEGHDHTVMKRGNSIEEVYTMRDNVLFEIGLCAMALGLPRTILLTDDKVRMPDDLTGANNTLAVHRVIYDSKDPDNCEAAGNDIIYYMENLQKVTDQIDSIIQKNIDNISPVVIGAAASTACGYVGNFVFRTLERLETGILLEGDTERRYFTPNQIYMHIILPEVYSSDTPDRAYVKIVQYQKGCVPDARMRKAEFRYKLIGDELHIYDYPTTLVTSYNTARIILNLDADDDIDTAAKDRFIAKEMNLFEGSILALLNRAYVTDTVKHYYKDYPEEKRQAIIEKVTEIVENRITVERVNY